MLVRSNQPSSTQLQIKWRFLLNATMLLLVHIATPFTRIQSSLNTNFHRSFEVTKFHNPCQETPFKIFDVSFNSRAFQSSFQVVTSNFRDSKIKNSSAFQLKTPSQLCTINANVMRSFLDTFSLFPHTVSISLPRTLAHTSFQLKFFA